MTCKTCKWLDVPPNKAGKIVVYKQNAYRCSASIPLPVLPRSVTSAYGFHWPPRKTYMSGDGGEGCPLHEKREKK